MNISIGLSTDDIQRVIQRIKDMQTNLNDGVKKVVDIITTEGAEIAQSHYGDMATVTGNPSGNTGEIIATGDAVVIAEFGAGDATLPVMFENDPGFIFPGSYSLMVGSKEYAFTGKWHWNGLEFTEIEPRAGLYNAKYYIKEYSTEICREAIKL